MIKKDGITITMLVITIIILSILTTVITVSVSSTIASSKFTTWITETTYIQETVNDKLNQSSTVDFVDDTISINTKSLTTAEKVAQFEGETIDINGNVTLKVLNLGKIGIVDTMYGNLEDSTDVYAISTTTNKVYYVRGMVYEGNTYYTLTENIGNRFGLETANKELTSIVFKPNKIGYSNEPIYVLVSIPAKFSNISISCSNESINISGLEQKNDIYQCVVNQYLWKGNYTITVSYQNEGNSYTETYNVTGYDVTPPTIKQINEEDVQDSKDAQYITNVSAEDTSGIKYLKYYEGKVTDENVKEFFKSNGKDIINSRIKAINNIYNYTIYAEDNAGNYSTITLDSTYFKVLVSTEKELLEALATKNSNIKLVKDIICTNPVTLTSGEYKLDLNGYDITYTNNTSGFTFMTIESGANVLIKDTSDTKDGKIKAQLLEETYNGSKADRYNTIYTIANSGTLTIESGEVASTLRQLPGEQKENIYSKCHAKTINNTGTINLNGGIISSYIESQGVSYLATRNGEATAIGIENTGTVNLNSGKITAEAHAYMKMTGIVYGETRAYAYGVTNATGGVVNREDAVIITVSATAHEENSYTETVDSAEIKQL